MLWLYLTFSSRKRVMNTLKFMRTGNFPFIIKSQIWMVTIEIKCWERKILGISRRKMHLVSENECISNESARSHGTVNTITIFEAKKCRNYLFLFFLLFNRHKTGILRQNTTQRIVYMKKKKQNQLLFLQIDIIGTLTRFFRYFY